MLQSWRALSAVIVAACLILTACGASEVKEKEADVGNSMNPQQLETASNDLLDVAERENAASGDAQIEPESRGERDGDGPDGSKPVVDAYKPASTSRTHTAPFDSWLEYEYGTFSVAQFYVRLGQPEFGDTVDVFDPDGSAYVPPGGYQVLRMPIDIAAQDPYGNLADDMGDDRLGLWLKVDYVAPDGSEYPASSPSMEFPRIHDEYSDSRFSDMDAEGQLERGLALVVPIGIATDGLWRVQFNTVDHWVSQSDGSHEGISTAGPHCFDIFDDAALESIFGEIPLGARALRPEWGDFTGFGGGLECRLQVSHDVGQSLLFIEYGIKGGSAKQCEDRAVTWLTEGFLMGISGGVDYSFVHTPDSVPVGYSAEECARDAGSPRFNVTIIAPSRFADVDDHDFALRVIHDLASHRTAWDELFEDSRQ